MIYDAWLVLGLILAVYVNAYPLRSLAMPFIGIGFLLVLPRIFPETVYSTELRFPVMIFSEMAFAGCLLLTKAKASPFIAGVCAYNVLAHLFGWVNYEQELNYDKTYQFWLQTGESIQVLAMVISSRLVMGLILTEHRRCIDKKKDADNGYRLLANYS